MTGEKGGMLHWERIDLALWDAIAYGDGILQLLENSVQHSRHNAGYLTLVVHDIGMQRSGQLTEAASKREKIFRRYRSYISEPSFLPLDANFVMEFNVTDMSYDDAWAPKGIPVCANRSLSTLFSGDFEDRDPQDIDNIIHHYGMPLFYKTIRLNGGRFACISPKSREEASFFIPNHDKGSTNKELTVASHQAWTTYRILLPLTHRSSFHTEQFYDDAPTPFLTPKF